MEDIGTLLGKMGQEALGAGPSNSVFKLFMAHCSGENLAVTSSGAGI